MGGFSTNLQPSFGISYWRIRYFGMKQLALKAKEDSYFWSSENQHKGFSNIIDSIKYDLQKWILPHPHVIQYPIANDCIKVDLDSGNGGANT